MNEFERKLYLKYRNIENMTQLLCLKLYRLTLIRSAGEGFPPPIKLLITTQKVVELS